MNSYEFEIIYKDIVYKFEDFVISLFKNENTEDTVCFDIFLNRMLDIIYEMHQKISRTLRDCKLLRWFYEFKSEKEMMWELRKIKIDGKEYIKEKIGNVYNYKFVPINVINNNNIFEIQKFNHSKKIQYLANNNNISNDEYINNIFQEEIFDNKISQYKKIQVESFNIFNINKNLHKYHDYQTLRLESFNIPNTKNLNNNFILNNSVFSTNNISNIPIKNEVEEMDLDINSEINSINFNNNLNNLRKFVFVYKIKEIKDVEALLQEYNNNNLINDFHISYENNTQLFWVYLKFKTRKDSNKLFLKEYLYNGYTGANKNIKNFVLKKGINVLNFIKNNKIVINNINNV